MKSLLILLLASVLILSLSACAGSNTPASPDTVVETSVPVMTEEPASQPVETDQPAATDMPQSTEAAMPESASEPETPAAAALVVYFSWSGNTEAVATEIQRQTGADLFEIIPATPYTDDYNTLLDVAQQEQRSNARPAISGRVENMGTYDMIYLGYPNWWGDMPMILYSFLDSYDLSGKTIAPFCTSGGSGFSGTLKELQALEQEANVAEGLHIGSGSANNSQGAVAQWLGKLGVTE